MQTDLNSLAARRRQKPISEACSVYVHPIHWIIKYLVAANRNNKKILEIGPGLNPFPLATHFIDHISTRPDVINLDICNNKFPFADNEFEFVYARHVLGNPGKVHSAHLA